MFAIRAAVGCAVLALAAAPTPALKLGVPKANHHHHYLIQAEKDLKAAEAAAASGNPAAAHRLVAAAITQIEHAIRHHRQHYLAAPRGGLSGALFTAAHHHHHSHLQHALADCRAAEKQLRAGHAGKAVKDIEKAERQVAIAIESHHRLIGN